MTTHTRTLAALTTGILALSLSACTGDDEASPNSSTSQTASATSTTTTATTATSSTPSETPSPEPVIEAPAAVSVPESQNIWAPQGQGTRCPGTDAYVWDYADCNPSNGVIDPEEFYRLTAPTPVQDESYRSDGCVGPAATCGYYDDAGNPIWFDKETGETSPRYYDDTGNPIIDTP